MALAVVNGEVGQAPVALDRLDVRRVLHDTDVGEEVGVDLAGALRADVDDELGAGPDERPLGEELGVRPRNDRTLQVDTHVQVEDDDLSTDRQVVDGQGAAVKRVLGACGHEALLARWVLFQTRCG